MCSSILMHCVCTQYSALRTRTSVPYSVSKRGAWDRWRAEGVAGAAGRPRDSSADSSPDSTCMRSLDMPTFGACGGSGCRVPTTETSV